MTADHEKNYRDRHERVVLGTQFGLGAERRVELFAGSSRGDELALRGQDLKPDVRRHDGPHDRSHVDIRRATAENMRQSPGQKCDHR